MAEERLIDALVKSENADSIYYADLVRIHQKNWMILGCGKSTAAYIASGKDDTSMLAFDSVAIIRNDDHTLWGRFDAGARRLDAEERPFEHLDAIAYCLSEEQTVKAYAPRNGVREILECGHELLFIFVANYPYPAACAEYVFSEDEYEYLANPHRMVQKFYELGLGAIGTKFLIVPFMSSVEEKAALYSNYSL